MDARVKLVWATPDADKVIGYCARVSNPSNQNNPEVEGLLRYCAREGHWSVFEMANVCIEIETTRDIGRQILRHRSFSFQELSQRYKDVSDELRTSELREARMQDKRNRQNSVPCTNEVIAENWQIMQEKVFDIAKGAYEWAIERGIAKEQARALLPEGLTPSKMYANGTMRSWIHYLRQRLDPSTQREHRMIAEEVLKILTEVAPITMSAFFNDRLNADSGS
jgi:thymidylate synthase (FAD)